MITLTHEGDRWVARFPFSYTTKDIVKEAGFRFDSVRKVWWTRDADIAAKFDPQLMKQRAALARDSFAGSFAKDSDLAVPIGARALARGFSLYPFQRAGIAYAMSREATLIADEMGLGKTIQAIGVINLDPTIRHVLVICKASLKINWEQELRMWLSRDLTIARVNGGKFVAADIVIINYEMVAKHRDSLDLIAWDLMIVDECHMLKNAKAQRTHAVFGKAAVGVLPAMSPIAARRKIFMTGTPILNRPIELWTLVHALQPDGMGRSYRAFTNRYCNAHRGPFGWDVTGASNLDELQTKLRSSLMVRRLKCDVLTELPPKRRQVIKTPSNTAAARAAVAREHEVVAKTEAAVAAARSYVESLPPDVADDVYKDAVRKLRAAEGIAFSEIALVRHQTALVKVPDVVEHLVSCLEETDGKIVCFAHHHDVVDAIANGVAAELNSGGMTVIKADGRDSLKKRNDCVEAFQRDKNVRLFVVSIQAMAEGITLTAASHVVFAELDWVPGKLSQAEDRCHRIGQRDSVLVQHVVLDGSLDGRMAQILVEKQAVIEAALNNGAAPEEQQISEAVKAALAGNGATKAPASADAPELPAEQIAAIHQGLKQLAAMCDGARALDDHGFNKLDTAFGHDLASKERLTARQALAGRSLVIKYQRQLSPELIQIAKGASLSTKGE